MAINTQAADSVHEKIVIAHRGACGYLPEHTFEAKVLAHAQGADYIEQDVVMTRDEVLVVFHDLTLDRLTDVAEKYPGRARMDGHFYVIDFSFEELRELRVSESRIASAGISQPVYPSRFPPGLSRFTIHTLSEEIELIQGLNASTGREAGLYVEIKSPWFHRQAGVDLSEAVLQVLGKYGYKTPSDKVFLQTFDFNELKRLRKQLLPLLGMDVKLVQLIARNEWEETFVLENGEWLNYDYGWMHEEEGMAELGRFAEGVGPAMDMIVLPDSTSNEIKITPLVARAHAAGLVVHPFTLRRDPGQLPAYAENFERLLDIFFFAAGVDGVFTDYPDLAVNFLGSRRNLENVSE